MAWKRGTQNNLASEIRMGHIEEFTVASSKASAGLEEKVRLKVVASEKLKKYKGQHCAFAQVDGLPAGFLGKEKIYVHAHEHPTMVVRLENGEVEEGCIALSEAQRLNSRVCENQTVDWTLYRGRHVSMDIREGALGNTDVEVYEDDPELAVVVFEVRPRSKFPREKSAKELRSALATLAFDNLVSVDEIFDVDNIVARVTDVQRVDSDDDEFRGYVTAATKFYVVSRGSPKLTLTDNNEPPARKEYQSDIVEVTCAEDDEIFPVKRDLLRPCIALTRVAMAGNGKYDEANTCAVPMDCCTFDRVLLYLEHLKKKGDSVPFKFDPTLAPLLLRAAEQLQIAGLQRAAQKVLGSFQDRVRGQPIRLSEIKEKNRKGTSTDGKRTETLLVVDGMVLDVSRWLHEHPGGSAIIPEQALDVDATVMFECYHVSRQSFLYLKEFYIGELAKEDLKILPLPNNIGDLSASPAFLEALRRYTPWRLKDEDLDTKTMEQHKSF